MSEIQTKTLNVEVSAHSKYGAGTEQAVGFQGIEGFWKLNRETAEKAEGNWPPAIGHVLNATLKLKPKPNGGFYQDITGLAKATGPAESWDIPQTSPQSGPSGPSARPTGSGGYRGGDTDLSIQKQVALKCETEVLCELLRSEGQQERFKELWPQWRDHCRLLLGVTVSTTGPAVPPDKPFVVEAVDPEKSEGNDMDLMDVPF